MTLEASGLELEPLVADAQEARTCAWNNAHHVTFDNNPEVADTVAFDQAIAALG